FNLLNKGSHLFYSFSRYKFASKMVGQNKTVLELGCSEALGTLLIAQNNCRVKAVDFDHEAINWSKEQLTAENLEFVEDEFLGKTYGAYDAVVSLDVIEHILPENEETYVDTIHGNLNETGMCVVGTPNITAQEYASKASKDGHINLFSAERLKKLFLKKFRNVFVFGMNDEVVHTGYYPMSHYLMLLACFPRDKQK
ncbi:MAG: class I SAM-dependent methyltransferase, partial [bacterium]|nr:class I SAM-dependent methyltransferase [bacterium]